MSLWSATVRYAECDQQGVAFHGHYLTWADEAATALMAARGMPYVTLRTRGLDTSVVASTLSWSSSARWGDLVEVDGVVERLGRTSFTFILTIRVDQRVCCVVTTTYVLVDDEGRPVPLPEDLRQAWAPISEAPASS